MRRFSIILLAITLSTPARATAQQEARAWVSPAIHLAGDSTQVARFRGAMISPPSPAATSARGHHAWSGAVIGAVFGAAAGIVGSRFVAVGCTRDPCHATRTQVDLAAWLGSLGALGGGIVGAAVGAILPASSRGQ